MCELIIQRQNESPLLAEISKLSHTVKRKCCSATYKSKIVCDAVNVLLRTSTDKGAWMSERQYRITASRCYSLYTYKGDNWEEKVQNYVHARSFSNIYTQHGETWEPIARQTYAEYVFFHMSSEFTMFLIFVDKKASQY